MRVRKEVEPAQAHAVRSGMDQANNRQSNSRSRPEMVCPLSRSEHSFRVAFEASLNDDLRPVGKIE